jgi:hypothetical protein
VIRRVQHRRVGVLYLRDRLGKILDRLRNVVSVAPSSSTIGSSKRFDQPLSVIADVLN